MENILEKLFRENEMTNDPITYCQKYCRMLLHDILLKLAVSEHRMIYLSYNMYL